MFPLGSLVRLWRALDDCLERVEPTPWGAVVTDSRFPQIHDVNYARVEPGHADVTAGDIDAVLRPALAGVGRDRFDAVLFDPHANADLIVALSSRGETLSWDVAMLHRNSQLPEDSGYAALVELVEPDGAFWRRQRDSLPLFGDSTEDELDAVARLEREVMTPGTGKRWYAIREKGRIVSMGSLVLVAGVGYLDHVVTFPEGRGRGRASAIVTRMVAEAHRAGVRDVWLLAESEGPAVKLYRRLGFSEAGRLASFTGSG